GEWSPIIGPEGGEKRLVRLLQTAIPQTADLTLIQSLIYFLASIRAIVVKGDKKVVGANKTPAKTVSEAVCKFPRQEDIKQRSPTVTAGDEDSPNELQDGGRTVTKLGWASVLSTWSWRSSGVEGPGVCRDPQIKVDESIKSPVMEAAWAQCQLNRSSLSANHYHNRIE
ncbi:hypothetical protein J6590_034025, partial [Homalodisca vitripennis]